MQKMFKKRVLIELKMRYTPIAHVGTLLYKEHEIRNLYTFERQNS